MATKKTVAKKAAPAKKIAKPAAKSGHKPALKKIAKHVPVKKGKASATKSAHKPALKKPVHKAAVKAASKPAKKTIEKKPSKPVAKSHPQSKVAAKPTIKTIITPKASKPEPVREVKVPKTSVKTSVPYQPGYTPLEKRADSSNKTSEPLVRYSDADLAEFRSLINKKLEAAKKELAYLQGLI